MFNLEIKKDDRQWLHANYPTLRTDKDSNECPKIAGLLKIDMVYQEGKPYVIKPEQEHIATGRRIQDEYEIDIIFKSSEHSDLPQVYEKGNRIASVAADRKLRLENLHVNPDGSACLCLNIQENDYLPNGFNLKGETVTKLLDLDIKGFQISLDGPREWHNKTRLRLSGQGSFDEIWNNLLALKKVERDFSVTLRVHVTPENLDYLPDLITQINQEFGSDARFKVFFKAIENLGGANSGSFKTLKGAEKSEIVAGLYKLLANSEKISSMGKQQQPYICYAAKPNNLVVRANGTIAKCTVVFNDDRNQLGKINPDGTLTISAEKLNLWVRGMKTMEKDTLHCPLHGLPKLEAKSRVIPIMAVNQ